MKKLFSLVFILCMLFTLLTFATNVDNSTASPITSYGVYVLDLTTKNASKIETTNKIYGDLPKYSPSMYDDIVVWEGYENFSSNDGNIYAYNLSTRIQTTICNVSGLQTTPKIYKNYIVWTDYRYGNADIYLYNLSTNTEKQLTTDTANQTNPSIYEDKAVWQDERNGNLDIYLYNPSTNNETRITTNNSNQYNPVIYDNILIWVDDRCGNLDVFVYNLTNSLEIQITNDTSDQESADIFEDKIVWQDNRNNTWSIYIYNLSSNNETKALTSSLRIAQHPKIYDNQIVYEKYMTTGGSIHIYNLSTNNETLLLWTGSNQKYPEIYENYVIWYDGISEYGGGHFIIDDSLYLIVILFIGAIVSIGFFISSTMCFVALWSTLRRKKERKFFENSPKRIIIKTQIISASVPLFMVFTFFTNSYYFVSAFVDVITSSPTVKDFWGGILVGLFPTFLLFFIIFSLMALILSMGTRRNFIVSFAISLSYLTYTVLLFYNAASVWLSFLARQVFLVTAVAISLWILSIYLFNRWYKKVRKTVIE